MWWGQTEDYGQTVKRRVGKTSSADGALSACKRNGPDPQTSIRARGE
jgi:hypothetical protein